MTTPDQEPDLKTLKELDPDRFLEQIGAVLLHKSDRGNELHVINRWLFNEPESYFLRYSCPSTGRVYVKGIRPDIGMKKDADLAQAWSFGLNLEEYQYLAAES